MKQRILSIFLCACVLLSLLPHVELGAAAASTVAMVAGGWNETIWAKISNVTDGQITGVSYAGAVSGSLTGQDLEYLVRDENGQARIDIPGVPAGTYTLTVTTASGTITQSDIVVPAQDRSGYAHFGDTEGVGAYDNQGKLKKNAIILYVTDANKNTVSVTSKDGTTVTGIGNILGSTGMDVGNGRNSKGGKANTNQNILRKLAADGTPLVVRFIGRVTAPEGLTAYNSVDYGGSVGDNGYMARMSGGKNITIEGVGTGATIDGWGFHFICQSADYAAGYGRSFEARNLSFRNVPEDCLGMEGQQNGDVLTAPVERCWIHNCAFYGPTIANPAESDKDGGDGACDFKRGQYFTNAYCYYEGYHKTNLVGSSNSSLQYHMTYHHNYWKNCESRGPLARQANIHMYNNIFEEQSSYCINPRANAYIFSEYNLFLKCKSPAKVDSGAVKSYHDSFTSCVGDNDATIVTNRSEQVSTDCKYADFDTNPALSYIPSGDYVLQESIPEMKAVVLAEAGPQPAKIVSAEETDISMIPGERMPTAAVKLPYSQHLNKTSITEKSGTFDNIVFRVAKLSNDSVSVGGSASDADIVFYVNTTVNISMTEGSGSYSPVLCNAAGEAILVGTGSAKNLPAGYYFIQSSGYDVGSSKYKEAKISALTIEAAASGGTHAHTYAAVVTEPTCTEGGYTTYTCTCGDSYISDQTPKLGHSYDAEGVCVNCKLTKPVANGYVHNFTESGKESDFYTISGNLSTSKGTVSYNGLTLTRCLKIESSTSIRFAAEEDGTLTLVFGNGSSGKGIRVDGTDYTIGADGIATIALTVGSHEIRKHDSVNLFYMVYTPEAAAHTHSYSGEVTTAATCTADGITTYTCACGDSYTVAIPATGHSYHVTDFRKPTCTAEGSKTYCCTVAGCDAAKTQAMAAVKHAYGEDGICDCGAAKLSYNRAGGWLESCYIEWAPVEGATGYHVYYQRADAADSWVLIDSMLVREYAHYWRADAVGLPAGSYMMMVVPILDGKEETANPIITPQAKPLVVTAYDRSDHGYAPDASLEEGRVTVGAYNADGTLKAGAVVVYVTDANKNTVQATIDGTTYTGVSNILAADVLKNATVPVCIRLVGKVTNLTGDEAGCLLIENGGNTAGLTIEGVGEDAVCDGFGIRLDNAANVEVRNLAVMHHNRAEGAQMEILPGCSHIWVHNCDLFTQALIPMPSGRQVYLWSAVMKETY